MKSFSKNMGYYNSSGAALPTEAEPYLSNGTLSRRAALSGEMSGWFNRNYVFLEPSGEKKVLRVPKSPEETRAGREYVEKEFGLLGLPSSSWGFYSIGEQAEKTLEWKGKGIPVLEPIAGNGNSSLLYPFVNGNSQTYQDLLSKGEGSPKKAAAVAREFFRQIGFAHSKGAVLGDRWGPNEFIIPGTGVIFFDFDERLSDPDFESAQAAYYTLRYCKGRGREFIKEIAQEALSMMRSGEGNPIRAIGFLETHGEYFQEWHPWGSRERETSYLVEEILKKAKN